MRRMAAAFALSLPLLLSGCILYPGQHLGPTDQSAGNLGGARFTQQQAVEGFDTSSYTLSDDQVDDFRDLLAVHDVDPGDYTAPESAFCPGGITTRVQMWFHDNGDKEMIIGSCADEGTFEADATEFFTTIRGGDAPDPDATIPETPDDEG